MKKKKKDTFPKKKIIILASTIFTVLFIVALILFFINKVPSKYYGTYVRYSYFRGNITKTTYKISPLSIKSKIEYTEKEKKKSKSTKYKYYKKGSDLIIKEKNYEEYLILDHDRLFIKESKDISAAKEFGFFYWNTKSKNADLYEIENKAEGMEDLLETTMTTWTRESVYRAYEKKLEDKYFYILKSKKKVDKTDLNTYEVIYDAAGGELSFYYDRKTKKLERIYFNGSILSSPFSGSDYKSMSPEDIYDAEAMLLSLMYITGNKDNIELNLDTKHSKEYDKSISDLTLRQSSLKDLRNLLENKQVDTKHKDRYTYSFSNDKYYINYTNWISTTEYTATGLITFNIDLDN